MRLSKVESIIGCVILLILCFTYFIHMYLYEYSRNWQPITYASIQKYRPTGESVVVAIVMHSPSKFLKSTLMSLNESDHFADAWIFRNFVDDFEYQQISEWYPKANIYTDEGRANSTRVIGHYVFEKFLSSKHTVLVYINSYSFLSLDWWDTLKKSLDQSHGVFSLYGIERDQKHSEKCNDILCYQTWLGIVGSVWRRELVTRMMFETKTLDGDFNRKLENWCILNSIPLQTVRNSAVTIVDSDKIHFSELRHRRSSHLGNDMTLPNENTVIQNKTPLTISRGNRSFKPIQNMRRTENLIPVKNDSVTPKCIAAVIRVRIYRDDKPELTTYELEQWIRYVQHAGVDVVYLYDAYEREEEKLNFWVKQVFEPNEVKYHDWYFDRTFEIHESQRSAYQHAADHYKYNCEWHLHMDMDEYPFVPEDTEKGFLKRLIPRILSLKPTCTEISFPNFLFISYPTEEPWLIARIQRRIEKRANRLDKPLGMASLIKLARLHHNQMEKGTSEDIKPNIARMNHYWGARMQNWEPDTPLSLSKTVVDTSVLPILRYLKRVPLLSNKMPLYVTNRFWYLKY